MYEDYGLRTRNYIVEEKKRTRTRNILNIQNNFY